MYTRKSKTNQHNYYNGSMDDYLEHLWLRHCAKGNSNLLRKIYKITLGFEFCFLLTIKATKRFLQLRDAIGTYYIHLEEGAGNTVLISILEK